MTLLLLLGEVTTPPPPPPPSPPAAERGGYLYPGATTYPSSTTYPGQGERPLLQILISTDDVTVSSPTWTYVAETDMRSFTISRGRESELAEDDAGTATVVLDNRDRAYDPLSNPLIRPLNRIWLREQFSGETQDLFMGYVSSYDQQWPDWGGSDATVTLDCVDEFKLLSLAHLPTTSPPRPDYGELVKFDNPSDYWPIGGIDFAAGKISAELGGHDFVSTVYPDGEPVGAFNGLQTPGPIVGDTRQNVGTINFQVGVVDDAPNATTGELRPEDSLAMVGLSSFTVEAWLGASSFGSTTETLIRGPQGNLFFKFEINISSTGVVSCTVRNFSETAYTLTGNAIVLGQFSHVVVRLAGGVLALFMDGAQVAATSFDGTTSSYLNVALAFTGLITVDPNSRADWRLNHIDNNGSYYVDELAFYQHGLANARISAHYQAGTQRGYRSGRSAQRVRDVLDTIGSHAPRTLSDISLTRLVQPVYMQGQSPLTEIRSALEAESVDARFFIGRDGSVVFLSANHRTGTDYATAQMELGDQDGEIPYADIDFDYSDSFLVNEWNVTRDGGELQTARDEDSIDAYFKREQSISGIRVVGDSDAQAIAVAMLAKTKDPMLRCTRVVVSSADQDAAVGAFRRDLGDKIRIFRTPPGGGSRIDQSLWIQKIEIAGDNSQAPWMVNWTVSPV